MTPVCVTSLLHIFLRCGWFLPSSAGAYTGKVKVTGYNVQRLKRDQPGERQRENIPSGEELIEPVDFFWRSLSCAPAPCILFFKYPENLLVPVCGAR